jgi:hypothetical protein
MAEGDSVRAGELLADGIIEPAVSGAWALSMSWGRAFLHAQVEWIGGVTGPSATPAARG